MNQKTAAKLLALIEAGDDLAKKRAKATTGSALAERLSARIKEIDREIAALKSEIARQNELAVLRSRAHESEHDLDAWLEALVAAERWSEVVEAAGVEIERLIALGSRASPIARSRLRQLVEIHNDAIDRSVATRAAS